MADYTFNTRHPYLNRWVLETAEWCTPENIVLCKGTAEELNSLKKLCVNTKLAVLLNPGIKPDSLLFRTDPSDVARVETRTFISTPEREDAGPTNNWVAPDELKSVLKNMFKNCMTGRTMYVIPFLMGPKNSDFSLMGVEITDSPYVVINMMIMTRMGPDILENLGTDGHFIPCLHSVGKPLKNSETDNGIWPCAPVEKKYIAHFPHEKLIWSFGSGYGGNALLSKKCMALRIASYIAREQGWFAEHMLILKITNPEGKSKFIAAAFPSACGKTNLAMLVPSLPEWKVETVGDDIAWLRFDKDNRLYAVNPEKGFFGVAPGTSWNSNPNAMHAISHNAIYTNTAMTPEGDVWWEGIGTAPPEGLTDWTGKPWAAGTAPAAHPNSRFTAPVTQCPSLAPEWDSPEGVPISAILFGGRRASVIPLVHEARSWNHGVFMGSVIGSEITSAALDLKTGTVRRDPFAMLPFCGYHMGDYLDHWIKMGKNRNTEKLPQFFFVNWFRKNSEGKWLWPGYGENMRVLKWIFERCDGKGSFLHSPVGLIPAPGAIEAPSGTTPEEMNELLTVDPYEWSKELRDIRENLFPIFGDRFPTELWQELNQLTENLKTEVN